MRIPTKDLPLRDPFPSKCRMYPTWGEMKARCSNPKNNWFKYYGARGIQVYPLWIDDFNAYNEFVLALPNALKEGYTIDRIENDGNYEPGNLRWASREQQRKNRRRPIKYRTVKYYRDIENQTEFDK